MKLVVGLSCASLSGLCSCVAYSVISTEVDATVAAMVPEITTLIA